MPLTITLTCLDLMRTITSTLMIMCGMKLNISEEDNSMLHEPFFEIVIKKSSP